MSKSTSSSGFYALLTALCLLALLTLVSTAHANPQGGTVTNGAASITSAGNTETITQSTQNAVINWQSFNIGPNQTTNFVQPNAAATTLNRVAAGNPSQILGALDANGNVIVINPNGVFFGKGSQTDVNGLVATTASLSSQNLMEGKQLNFSQPGNPNAQVINNGTITAGQAGLVGLVAATVINNGTINAKLGHVDLGSGDTFTLDTYGDGLITLGVSDAVRQQLIKNSGTINAAGGTIALTAGAGRQVVNSLVAVPGKLNAPTAVMRNGEIEIINATPNGRVQISGSLNATGLSAGQTGGKVNVTGSQVGIKSGAMINASGYAGGGAVNIGGDLHGQGPLANARSTLVNTGATVKANAINQGNGGQVVIWSNQQTTVKGQIEAQGGTRGGNGGFIETSSDGVLDVETPVEASAPKGKAGTWLLDPASVDITNGTDTAILNCPTCIPDGTLATSILSTTTIDTALNAGTNVSITTGGDAFAGTGDITVSNTIFTTGTGALTLSSYRDIIVNAGITLAGGSLLLQADNHANGSGYIDIEAPISTGGGNITMGGGNGVITAGTGFAFGNVGQVIGVLIDGAVINAGGGNIVINGDGFSGLVSGNSGVESFGGSISTLGAGTIIITGIGAGTGLSRVDDGVLLTGGSIVTAVDGAITINGTGGGTSTGEYGVSLPQNGANTIETTGDGSILITGRAGGGGAGNNDFGVFLAASQEIAAAGTGSITVSGTGGAGGGGNATGVFVAGSIVANGGGSSITGQGGASAGNANLGIEVTGPGAAIANAGTGGIVLDGTGGGSANSANNHGVQVDTGGIVYSTSGDLTVTATGGGAGTGSNNDGLLVTGGGSTIETTGTGNISIAARGGNNTGTGTQNDGVYINTSNAIQSTGSGTSLNIAGTGGGSTGGANDGVVLASGSVSGATGQNILIKATSGSGPGADGFSADSASVNATGSGNITIVTDTDSFVAPSTLTTGAGRWLVYSGNPPNNADGAFEGNFVRYDCVYGGSCPSFPAIGDGLLYSYRPEPPLLALPGPVIAAITGPSTNPDDSNNPGAAADGASSGGMNLRTVQNTSSVPLPVNPCTSLAAQDALPNQMTHVMDIVSISSELAETLPFYKIETPSFDAAHISCASPTSQSKN